MSDDIELKNGVYSFVHSAFAGPAWHKKGKELPDTATPDEWRTAAGHNFTVSKRQSYFHNGAGVLVPHPGRFSMVRDDNDYGLGQASKKYIIANPYAVDDICDEWASYDPNLQRAASFTLRQGDLICSSYVYRDDVTIGGAKHHAYLMASTSFDGTSASKFWISLICAVCANTIAAGLGESDAVVTVRHNTKLDGKIVREKLADLASQVTRYKALGDMLASNKLSGEEIGLFIRDVLDIPRDMSADDVSTKKKNQRQALIDAMQISANERAQNKSTGFDAFTVLQGVTRYVDHERSTRNVDGDESVSRFDSAQFGSGAKMKNSAALLLANLISERNKVAA